jgi:LSD1 subclass zinc finger protein
MTMSTEEGEAYTAWRKQSAQQTHRKLAMPEEKTPVDELLGGDHGRQSFMAGMDLHEAPEFQEHECWRMLLIYPPDDDGPMRVRCSGCDAVGRIEWEYTP